MVLQAANGQTVPVCPEVNEVIDSFGVVNDTLGRVNRFFCDGFVDYIGNGVR